MPYKKAKNKPKQQMPIYLLIGGGILVIIAAIFLAVQNLPSQTAQAPDLGIPFPNIVRTSVEDTKKAADSQQALIVDVRDSGSFAAGHIAGAINIPLDELESRLSELPKQSWIITYCT